MKVSYAKADLENYYPDKGSFTKLSYRPFDDKWTFFTGKSKGFHCYPRTEVMQHFTLGKNIGIVTNKPAQGGQDAFNQIYITKHLTDQSIYSAMNNSPYVCPLYLYPDTSGQQSIEQSEERAPNLKAEIVNQIAEKLDLTFTNEKEPTENTFAPIDILDYIYAVLHSPTYREKYKEFLKIDFPRVPYPKDQYTFWQLVKLGGEIRQIHLLESPTVEQYITQYPIDGDNLVSRKITKSSPGYVAVTKTHGKVYINDEQYFDNVPLTAWEFYIGGYQPAQKWLKDRKNRTLNFDDILHYQK